MEYITLAVVNKPFGLQGQMRCYSLTDFASLRFKRGRVFSLLDTKTQERKEITLSYFREAKPFVFLGFKEITSIEEVEGLLGSNIEIEKEKATLPKGKYHISDLIGCSVLNNEGQKLGVVKDVMKLTSTDTFRVGRENEKDFFVPFVYDKFIISINIEKKEIIINVIEGLL